VLIWVNDEIVGEHNVLEGGEWREGVGDIYFWEDIPKEETVLGYEMKVEKV